MIIIFLIAVTIFFFIACNLFTINRTLHLVSSGIAIFLIVFAIGLTIANMSYHYGAKLQTINKIYHLKPLSNKVPIILNSKVGSAKKHNIVVYRLNNKKKHTGIDINIHNKIIQNDTKKPKLKEHIQRWNYNKGNSLWFKLNNNHQIKNQNNTFYIPKNWTVLSINQAKYFKKYIKIFAKQLRQQQSNPQIKFAMQSKIQSTLQQKLIKLEQKHPTINNNKIKNYSKRIINSIKKNTKEKLAKQIISKAKNKALQQPQGYIK